MRKGTIDESLDSSNRVKLPINESSVMSDDPSSSELSKESP